ncbi:MAG: beta-lactamase family protein, partial [Gammaproteobacteria bacterium]|nr:beta-lactamase family protein [Gammaproteobacteria bacterium]
SALFVTAVYVFAAAGCDVSIDIQSDDISSTNIAEIDSLFASWDKPGSPGCALAVARDGDLVYSRGYGYSNLDYDIPITPQTVFDVASVTKQFNAASLTMLALEGKLSLDDDVRKWLPELPAFESPITLQHMIYHTSGLRDYLNLFPLAGRDDYHPISHPQILAMMSRQLAPNFPAGDRYAYSNTAYMLLAQVVERASGQSFGDFTHERIFEPLGMNGSRMYDNREEIIPHRSIGYDIDDNGHARIVHNYNFDVAGDGQLYSTMEDLLRWDNYLHGTDEPAIHSAMLTEGTLSNGEPTGYAQGLRLDEHRGLRRVGHSGSSWGFRTELVRYLDAGLSIAVSCNFDSARPGTLARQVADYYLADQMGPDEADETNDADDSAPNDGSEPPTLTSDQLADYAGDFFSVELDAIYRLAVENDSLVVRIEQQPPFNVSPAAEDAFETQSHPDGWPGAPTVLLEFNRDGGGAVRGFTLSAGSEKGILFNRT